MKTTRLLALAWMVALLLPVLHTDAVAQDEDALPIAPPEKVKAYLDALKAGEFYQSATSISLDEVEKLAPAWREIAPGGLTIEKGTMLMSIIEWDVEVGEDDNQWRLSFTEVEAPNRTRREVITLYNELDDIEWEVKPADLAELNFDIFYAIIIHHPLNRTLERHEISNQTLTDVVAGLCREAGVGFSIRADIADNLRVSQSLRGCTIMECLSLAASTAGWKVSIKERGRFRSDSSNDYEVMIDDVMTAWQSREFINVKERRATPIKTRVDALDYAVRDDIAHFREKGVIVVLNEKEKE